MQQLRQGAESRLQAINTAVSSSLLQQQELYSSIQQTTARFMQQKGTDVVTLRVSCCLLHACKLHNKGKMHRRPLPCIEDMLCVVTFSLLTDLLRQAIMFASSIASLPPLIVWRIEMTLDPLHAALHQAMQSGI